MVVVIVQSMLVVLIMKALMVVVMVIGRVRRLGIWFRSTGRYRPGGNPRLSHIPHGWWKRFCQWLVIVVVALLMALAAMVVVVNVSEIWEVVMEIGCKLGIRKVM